MQHLYAVAFQIVDDIHNFSRSPQWTKTAGEDIETGALDICRKQALRLTDEGWSKLACHLPPTEAKILLRAMCQKMLQFIYES